MVQVIGRRVVSRAAMEARRAGRESVVECRERRTERSRCRGMNELNASRIGHGGSRATGGSVGL